MSLLSNLLTPPKETSKQPLKEILFATLIGISGLIAIAFWSVILVLIIGVEILTDPLWGILLTSLAFCMGILTIFLFYMRRTNTPFTFLDINFPTWRDVFYIISGLITLFSILLIIGILFTYFGVETTSHSVENIVSSSPELILLLIPISLLLVGPLEELLYRNIIQKSLYSSFSPIGSIFISSIIFSAVHISAYAGDSLFQNPLPALNALAVIFILSVIIGIVYYQTKNIVTAALLHGIYDSIIFAVFYINITTDITATISSLLLF
tara:strand:+ start:37 stop:837 length:801 start_codon:yes stop_codon:yes gene_type:complete